MPLKDPIKNREYRRNYKLTNPDYQLGPQLRHAYFPMLSSKEALERYAEMHEDQNGSCAICLEHQCNLDCRLCVDHDHETGEVKGLLCRPCNRIEGLVRTSNIAKSILSYLDNPPCL